MPSVTRPPMRPRRRLRRPLPHWVVVAVCAAVPALVVGRLAADANAERARWGPGRPTVVVLVDVAAGDLLDDDDVEVRRLPAAARPSGAISALPDGAVAAADLVAGEAVVAARLAPAGSSAVAARLPRGTRGVALPSDGGLPLEVGDLVDVLATLAPDSGQPTVTVARSALVVHVGEEAVTVAVAADETTRVAYALAAGIVTLSLSGPRSR